MLACLLNQHITAQVESPRKQLPQKEVIEGQSSKKQIQAEMLSAINELNTQIADLQNQLAEAIKNKEDEETIKDLRDQIAMLKNQVEMMGGLGKTVSGISEKTFQQAGEKEPLVPKKDEARINMLPDKILTKEELILFIKQVHGQVERMIPAEEKQGAITIYNETKKKYNSAVITGNTASSFWMLGHSEKAIYIMGRACLDDMDNTDNLSNYAAFLTMAGAEQAALPILQYLNDLFPKNSTILNNIGQAWFGLGDLARAKEFLEDATSLYDTHSPANATLSNIALSEGDTPKAIGLLKASLKETYDPDKEAQLSNLGYTIVFDDLPPLNYPMKNDPLGLIPMMNTWPEELQTDVNEFRPVYKIQSFSKGVQNLKDKIMAEKKINAEKLREREIKISTSAPYRNKILEPHNSPAYKLAARRLQLRLMKAQSAPRPRSASPALPGEWLLEHCRVIWEGSVLIPIKKLLTASARSSSCADIDAATNAYLMARHAIYSRGVKLIKNVFEEGSKEFTNFIKEKLYGTVEEPPSSVYDLAYALIAEMGNTHGRSLIQNAEYLDLLNMINNAGSYQEIYKSQCRNPEIFEPDPDNLNYLVRPNVECEFKKNVKFGNYYSLKLVCNTITEKTDPKFKKKDLKTIKAQQGVPGQAEPVAVHH